MRNIIKSTLEGSVRVIPFKKQIFSIMRPFNPPKRVWGLLRFEGKFKVAVNENLFFYLNHYGQGFENGIFWKGLFEGWGEKQTLILWVKLCTQADTIFDIGANMGIYSLVAKTVNAKAQVFGFEPVEHIFQKFKQNCEINGFNISCVQAALSDVNGSTNIFINPGGLMTASLKANNLRTERERVKTLTLMHYIESQGITNVDLMKIDVEGYEPEVLQGMEKYLAAMKPTIILEVLSDEAGRKIDAIVRKCGYLYFNIDELQGPIRKQNLCVEGKSRHSRNFLLCTRAVADKLDLV
jgi:FkbM family methyltransferase